MFFYDGQLTGGDAVVVNLTRFGREVSSKVVKQEHATGRGAVHQPG